MRLDFSINDEHCARADTARAQRARIYVSSKSERRPIEIARSPLVRSRATPC